MVEEPHLADAALRSDIRLLGNLLGETLVRQEGPELLDLVERVRALTKRVRGNEDDDGEDADTELTGLLAGLDLDTTIQLVRAFSAYFYLANVAEQTHRLDEEGAPEDRRGRLAETVDRIISAGIPEDSLRRVVSRLELRPVFTAHPTEAARRSMLTKTNRVAELLVARTDPRLTPTDADRIERRLAEVIDLMWQTDELRRERPTPLDEAYSVRPMLAVSGGRLVALSTPFGTRGWWYDAWRSEETWERFEVPASDCPRISDEFLEEERRSMGEWWYQQEYECIFLDAETQPFGREDVDRAFEEEVEPWDL